jgi:lathosterol oxidase
MDVILDLLDTLLLDRLYASILPLSTKPSLSHNFSSNGTELTSLNQNVNRYIALSPSKWATQSILPRDHLIRQSLSLFLITWLDFKLFALLG